MVTNSAQDNNYMVNDLAAQAHQEHLPGPVRQAEQTDDHLFIFTTENGSRLLLHVLSDKILRFRYLTPESPSEPDFSYAVPDPATEHTMHPAVPTFLEFKEKSDHYRLTTARLICIVWKDSLRTRVLDRSGNILSADEKGFHWHHDYETGNDIVKMSLQVPSGVCYYGLGDKPANMNLRGQRFMNWGSDTYGYTKGSDPLYKNIPFFHVLHQRIAHGIFFDNTFKAFFDFAAERADITSFWAEGGEMNYYFIYGPTLLEVTEEYTRLTWPAPPPPPLDAGLPPVQVELLPGEQREGHCPGPARAPDSVRCDLPRHRLHGWLPLLYLAPAALPRAQAPGS